MTLLYYIFKNAISYSQVRAICLITVINVQLNIYILYIYIVFIFHKAPHTSCFNNYCFKLELATYNQTMNGINNI